uniref:Kinesin heavy chain n=1 Tax=Magallana gigas TaxID=29159 RepID=K1PLF2_MAGGI
MSTLIIEKSCAGIPVKSPSASTINADEDVDLLNIIENKEPEVEVIDLVGVQTDSIKPEDKDIRRLRGVQENEDYLIHRYMYEDSETMARKKEELKDLRYCGFINAKELQTLHNLRKLFVEDLQNCVKKVS